MDWHLWHLFLACWPPGLLYLFARHVETGDETLQLERANVAAAVAAAADADATGRRARLTRDVIPRSPAASSASANDETFDDLRRRMLEMETFLPLLREQRRRWLDAKEAGDDATDGDGGGADGRVDAREEDEESRRAGGFARRRVDSRRGFAEVGGASRRTGDVDDDGRWRRRRRRSRSESNLNLNESELRRSRGRATRPARRGMRMPAPTTSLKGYYRQIETTASVEGAPR